MREITHKNGYAKPQLKTFGTVQQLTFLTKTTATPSDGTFFTFSNGNPPIPAGSVLSP